MHALPLPLPPPSPPPPAAALQSLAVGGDTTAARTLKRILFHLNNSNLAKADAALGAASPLLDAFTTPSPPKPQKTLPPSTLTAAQHRAERF